MEFLAGLVVGVLVSVILALVLDYLWRDRNDGKGV